MMNVQCPMHMPFARPNGHAYTSRHPHAASSIRCFGCFEKWLEQSERGERMQPQLVFTLISCSQVDPSIYFVLFYYFFLPIICTVL